MWCGILLIFITCLTAVSGRASRPASKTDFIPMARALWEDLKATKELIGGSFCDKYVYCGLLHDMLQQYPDPHKHILDYIYLDDQQQQQEHEIIHENVQFMHEIYQDLLWAFECDGLDYF